MAGWKIPELNAGFELGKSPISMIHFPGMFDYQRVYRNLLYMSNSSHQSGKSFISTRWTQIEIDGIVWLKHHLETGSIYCMFKLKTIIDWVP